MAIEVESAVSFLSNLTWPAIDVENAVNVNKEVESAVLSYLT